jgi:hypothetical protein
MNETNPIRSDSSNCEKIADIQWLQRLRDLLKSWREGDEQEQRETLEFLQKVLDEDRFSKRKLFQNETGGIRIL